MEELGMVSRPATGKICCREEARPSVFDRLTSGNDQRVDSSRTRMRMDSVPADQGDDVYLDSGDGELPTTPARPILSVNAPLCAPSALLEVVWWLA